MSRIIPDMPEEYPRELMVGIKRLHSLVVGVISAMLYLGDQRQRLLM